MTETLYYITCTILSLMILAGISMMSKVKTAAFGNLLSALGILIGVIVTLFYYSIFSISTIYLFILIGVVIGQLLAQRVKMIEMPQLVAVLNGVGGAASALVGGLTLANIGTTHSPYPIFTNVTATLALAIGVLTFVGSFIAAGKLHKVLPQQPIVWKRHVFKTNLFLIGSLLTLVASVFIGNSSFFTPGFIIFCALFFSSLFGIAFAIRVGGADMPITISLLNSLSGVAGAIAGMAIGDILLVAVGGIVGASGLLLTQIMCKEMNRSLHEILLGKTSVTSKQKQAPSIQTPLNIERSSAIDLKTVKEAIIVPGYGMALAQAQHLVKQLADQLEANGARVRFAVHPVAGRMPGHMNVLLAEADVPYDQLYEMEDINPDFKTTDLVVVVGANDVLNPAARDAKDTPIYGMPVLNVDQAKQIIICNYDKKPGYAGVENPLYEREDVKLLLGDAKESLAKLIGSFTKKESAQETIKENLVDLKTVKEAIIVPGYGMALAQAQHLVKQLADQLEANGARVRFAVHPVAGRMPGHMNVLLAEADVPYDQLYEMEDINPDFKTTDLVVVVGANDVLNPAARDAKDTPIYGMPVLNVDQAKQIIICNYDKKPGYAGVENPLYEREDVKLLLGDAKESLAKLIEQF